jgi:hypothetical protein
MWVLVLTPVVDLDVRLAGDDVTLDEARLHELPKRFVDIDGVVRQDLGADLFWPVLESPLAVSHRPQSGKQEADHRWQFP